MKMEYYIYIYIYIYDIWSAGAICFKRLAVMAENYNKTALGRKKIYGGQFARFFSKCIVVIFTASVKLCCASQESDEKP